MTGRPSPYVGEIVDPAFSKAVAVVVLFLPDDEAKLRSEFLKSRIEADQIRRVLAAINGHKSRAAKILGIERKTLYRKLDQIGS